MAGDWLKVEISTLDKPEIWEIAKMLDIHPDTAFVSCLRVWSWFDQQTEDGNALSVSKALLDRLVGVSGFVDAMISVGWIKEDEGITVVNFDSHNGQSAKKRANTAKRVAKHSKKRPTNAPSVSPPLEKALAREEKRREDNTSTSSSTRARKNDNRKRFAMHLGWRPSFDEFTKQALKNAKITEAQIADELQNYIAAKIDDVGDLRTDHEWCKSFKNSLMRAKRYGESKAHAKNKSTSRRSAEPDFSTIDYSEGVNTDGSF